MSKAVKIFFVTDIHGSNLCYRKYLNALQSLQCRCWNSTWGFDW